MESRRRGAATPAARARADSTGAPETPSRPEKATPGEGNVCRKARAAATRQLEVFLRPRRLDPTRDQAPQRAPAEAGVARARAETRGGTWGSRPSSSHVPPSPSRLPAPPFSPGRSGGFPSIPLPPPLPPLCRPVPRRARSGRSLSPSRLASSAVVSRAPARGAGARDRASARSIRPIRALGACDRPVFRGSCVPTAPRVALRQPRAPAMASPKKDRVKALFKKGQRCLVRYPDQYYAAVVRIGEGACAEERRRQAESGMR